MLATARTLVLSWPELALFVVLFFTGAVSLGDTRPVVATRRFLRDGRRRPKLYDQDAE